MPITLSATAVQPHWIQCETCKGYFDPYDDTPIIDNNGFNKIILCTNCAKHQGLAVCERCDVVYDTDDLHDCDDHLLCDDCARDAGWCNCADCDSWLDPNEQYTISNCTVVCEECFSVSYGYCNECGEAYAQDELSTFENGVFCDSCSLQEGYGGNFTPAEFVNKSGCTTQIGSERCYGLELETDTCDNYNDLRCNGAWGAKNDPTCRGKELYSGILNGDAGLTAVTNLTDLADKNNWETSENCGYHLHIDMRQESDDSLFAAAYAYRAAQTVWRSFINDVRLDNAYCHSARFTCDDLASYSGRFCHFVTDSISSRYSWINLVAYYRHTTFEVRLHPGTCNKCEIINWIKAHLRFVDWACTIGFKGIQEKLAGLDCGEIFNLIAHEAWNDSDLTEYYARCGCYNGFAASPI